MDEMSYYWIAGAVFVLSLIVQQKLKSTYRTVTVGPVCTASMGVWVSGSRLTGSPQAASPVSCGGDAGCCGLLRAINGGESL
jgi:hypothetical protein